MPAICAFVDHDDIPVLVERFNADPTIAYLVPNGAGRWIARRTVDNIAPGRRLLWHTTAGPLPLIDSDGRDRGSVIEDPWSGWREQRVGGHPDLPWLGDPPNIFQLFLWPRGTPYRGPNASRPGSNFVGESHFSWIGNHYASLGRCAHQDSERWWRQLRRWLERISVTVTYAPVRGSRPQRVLALPAAWRALEAGADTPYGRPSSQGSA